MMNVLLLSVFFVVLWSVSADLWPGDLPWDAAEAGELTDGRVPVYMVSDTEGIEPIENTEIIEDKNSDTADQDVSMKDACTAMEQILDCGSKTFFCGYPVDESFLSWVGAKYGMETLPALAEELRAGSRDTQLWYDLTDNTIHVLWMEYCKAHGYATYLWQDVVWKEAADPSCIKLDFVGDTNFDDDWCTMKAAEEGGVESCISSDVREELKSADLTMVNNEFTYTDCDAALEGKTYTFQADPEKVKLLELFGTDIVSLANNHTFDYGEEGLLDTMDTLAEAGIVYSGAGWDVAEASAIRYFVVGGRKFAIVSATEIERFSHFTRAAGESTSGVLKTQQEEYVLAAIRKADANSDYVIAFIHWGAEGKINYDSEQARMAEAYVDAGADAIIGGHPHRLQGVSFVKNVPVAYSLGNFWFSTGTLYTTIAQLQVDADGELSLIMLPCVQKEMQTKMLTSEEDKKAFYQYVADISTNVGIDENGCFFSYRDVTEPGVSPYAYTSGRKYGLRDDLTDNEGRVIDIVGNLQ